MKIGRFKSIAKKYGITKKNPVGHGGARGNGAHLSSKTKDTSERSQREVTHIEREKRNAKVD